MDSGDKWQTDGERMGALIRKIRKASGVSQMALAERIGVSYQQVQKYERGSGSIAVTRLMQVARALDVPVEVFIGDDETTARYDPDEARAVAVFRSIRTDKFRRAAVEVLGIIERLNRNAY